MNLDQLKKEIEDLIYNIALQKKAMKRLKADLNSIESDLVGLNQILEKKSEQLRVLETQRVIS